jgi:nucleoside-diphosphate-sugar epimerase
MIINQIILNSKINYFNMKKILILGSRGQIGSHLLNFLKNKNYKTYEFDLMNNKSEDLRINSNHKFLSYIKKADFVFFLAFDVGGSVYLKKYQNSYNFLMNNISIMKNTFEVLYAEKKKFIFATSQMSNMIHSSYGVLKRIGEDITKSLGGISVRFWNVYGIEEDMEKSHVITDFITKALKKKNIHMLTNGNEERDFLYADDCCQGLEIVMKKYDIFKNKNIVDLSYGQYTKIIKVADIIKNLFKKKGINIKVIRGKKNDQLQKNKRNVPNTHLKKYWKPKFSLEQGIQEVFNFYFKQN